MNIYIDGSYGWTGTRIRGGLGICFYKSTLEHLSISVAKEPEEFAVFDNQAMEAMSMYVALWLTEYCSGVTIYSDCQHVVNCLTEWYDKFQNNGWVTSKNKPIAQRSILIECGKMIHKRKMKNRMVQIEKVHAHSGIPGNVIADQCAYTGMTSGATTDDIKRIVLMFTTTIGNSVASNADLNTIKEDITIVYGINSTDLINNHMASIASSTRTKVPIHSLNNIISKYNFSATPDNDEPPPPSAADEVEIVEEPPASEEVVDATVEDSDDQIIVARDNDITPDEDTTSTVIADTTLLTEGNYLFLCCFQHYGMCLIRYPDNGTCQVKEKLKISEISTIAFTTCKDCIVNSTQSTEIKEIADTAAKRAKSMRQMRMHVSVLEGSSIYNCALAISERTPTILTENAIVKYIPITDIARVCNNKCRASSIHIEGQNELPYLEFGFI
jgi:ribonuclease HI